MLICVVSVLTNVYSHVSLAVDNEKQPLSPVTGHPLPNLVLRVSHIMYICLNLAYKYFCLTSWRGSLG